MSKAPSRATCLAVKIEQIVPANRGFTMIMPGFGFLRDLFTTPFLVHWEMANGFAQSPQLPGVRIPGAPFMGVMGVAPSHELLQRIVAREAELLGRGGMVMPPDAAGAVPTAEAIAGKAIRTIAPHETGGNFDIKSLTAGATLYLPVQVPGALFSVGDAHFAQGDGESCGTAVETRATFLARFDVLKGEATRRRQHDPSYELPGHAHHNAPGVHGAFGVTPSKGYYATTGMSLRGDGRAEVGGPHARRAQRAHQHDRLYCPGLQLHARAGLLPGQRRGRSAHQPGRRRAEHDGLGRPAPRYLRAVGAVAPNQRGQRSCSSPRGAGERAGPIAKRGGELQSSSGASRSER